MGDSIGRLESVVYDYTDAIYGYTKGDTFPDSKIHGAYMGPSWGRQDPGEPHVGHMKFAIWDAFW